MTWLTWRQHRVQLYISAAALAALAVLLLITGLQMASQYHSALTACAANHSCGNLANTLFLGNHTVGFLVILTIGVPGLLGLFWGAPLVAGELEAGTTQFAWMQTVTRRRWLAVKTGWVLLAAAAWGGAVSALVTWWSGPDNALQLDAFNANRFDLQGIVPVAYALFAVALGIAAGTLLRRTLPAMAVTLAVFIAVRVVIAQVLRPHYMTAVTKIYSLGTGFVPRGSYLQLSQGVLGPHGQVISGNINTNAVVVDGVPANYAPAACQPLIIRGNRDAASCLVAHGYHGFVTYQPASRYWAFQGIETGIFVVLAAALIALTAFVLLRRDT
jgi:ABC-type transport system involved in multi-copper enzyme maturation permease subunit